MALRRRSLVAAGLLGLAFACSKPAPPPHRTEPWLANPSASATSVSAPRLYRFTGESSATFSLSGRKGKVSGRVPLAGGELRLDPRDLKLTRASLDVDLAQLGIETEVPGGLELDASSPDALALQWLELGPRVAAERRAQFATARFELVSLENLSAPSLELGDKPSTVRATVVGTLLIHGYRAPVRVDVALSTSGRESVAIRSVNAFVVPLAPHEITARDAAGVVDALGAARSAEWIGKAARVDFTLVAQASPNGK